MKKKKKNWVDTGTHMDMSAADNTTKVVVPETPHAASRKHLTLKNQP